MNKSKKSGYRNLLLNFRCQQLQFVFELQLTLEEMAQTNSESHRLYEMSRVLSH